MKRVLALVLVMVLAASFSVGFCQDKEVSKERVLAIATEAVKAKGIDIEGVSVVYDEGGKLWCEQTGIASIKDDSPNHGILKKGFLKNYKIVYFDFKDPLPDVWVFIDKDTGEVLEVYRME